MKYLGIDYGTKRTGLAISNDSGTVAVVKEVVVGRGQQDVIACIKKIVDDEKVNAVVVGLPLRADSTRSKTTEIIERFIAKLANHLAVPVQTFDERLTSVMADKISPHRKHQPRDHVAAQILLQNFLDQLPKS